MQHGSMKKLCGRNTHKLLWILKKIQAKNARLHFGQLEFQKHISKFLVTCADSPDKKMVQLDGQKAVKGAHSLGQQVEKNERLWLGLILESKKISKFYFMNIMM
jgi:hypothetical protein